MVQAAITPVGNNSEANRAAVLFVHGFTGKGEGTWADLGPRIMNDTRLSGWDGWSLTYGTSWLPDDISGVWSADADLGILALRLATDLCEGVLKRYNALVLIAHSMGGLVVQRALVDRADIAGRTHSVILFGTPSNGLLKARSIWFWKRQLDDMTREGAFVTALRKDWSQRVAGKAEFALLAVAGEKDQFVPPESSLAPFPSDQCAVIAGNHVTMIHPAKNDPSVVSLVVNRIVVPGPAGNVANSARVAAERGDFRRVVRELEPHVDEIDDSALVNLAIALDTLGRRDKAHEYLSRRSSLNPDILGTLAGRLKRKWLFSGRRRKDAEAAEAYYAEGFALARQGGDDIAAYYLGINVAFMALVFRGDRRKAREYAHEVLRLCEACHATGGDVWLSATQGEAYLILGKGDEALAAYRDFVSGGVDPWQLSSTYLNAQAIAGVLADRGIATRLAEIFDAPPP